MMQQELETRDYDHVIDLFELWQGLVDEKITILVTFLMALVLAGAYAFLSKPIYEAESYLLPPIEQKVLPMNELSIVLNTNTNTNTNTSINTKQSVFEEYITNLESRKTLQWIFNHYQLIDLYTPDINNLDLDKKALAQKKAFAEFTKSALVKKPKAKSNSELITVTLALALQAEEVAQILNAWIEYAEKQTLLKIEQRLNAEKQVRLRLLDDRISSVRKVALDKRLDRISKLDEAILVTEKLGINSPIGESTIKLNYTSASENDSLMYLLGSEFLKAEKAVLEARQNDDAFIADLRGLQEQVQKLNTLKIDKKKFGVVTIDEMATLGEKIKPKKALILAVAGVLGLMLGVFIALIRRAVKNRHQKELVKA